MVESVRGIQRCPIACCDGGRDGEGGREVAKEKESEQVEGRE